MLIEERYDKILEILDEEEYICANYITEIRKDFINNSSFLIPDFFYSSFFFRSRSINFKGGPSNPKALRNCFSR